MSNDSSSHEPRLDDEPVRAPAEDSADRAGEGSSTSKSRPAGIGDGQAPRNGDHTTEKRSSISAKPSAPAVYDSQQTVISKHPPVSPPAFRRAASPFEMGQSLAGEKLGHFQLEEFVGGGGMGAVFRATDTMLGRTVAVKVVSRDQTNEDTLRRFQNEAQSAARLDHPNIARVYYVGEDEGWNYIVFEYIEGVNVRDLVEHNGVLTVEDAISYTLQMAEALEHASQRDVTHRDIKPSNILIMLDGRAKLVDMGLARLQQVESSTDDLTASGVTLGTFDYISPEQARDPRNTDVRSDLYSLGCTLYFMLTGQPPFPEGTVLQKLLSHSSDEPPDLRQYRPDVDEEISRIVHRLLAKQPDARHQSPRELIRDLLLVADRLNLLGIHASSTIVLTANEPTLSWWVRHLPWLVPVALLLLFAAARFWLDTRPDPPMAAVPQLAASVENAPATPSAKPGPKADAAAKPDGGALVPPKAKLPAQDADVKTAADASDPTTAESTIPPSETGSPRAVEVPTEPAKAPGEAGSQAAPAPPVPKSRPDNTSTESPRPRDVVLPDRSERPSTAQESSETALTPIRPAAEPTSKTRVVVTDEKLDASLAMIAVSSLEEALQRAAELPGDAEIELRFDGVKLLSPLALDANRFPDQRIAIRAAAGYSPAIAFRPSMENRPANAPSSMIEIFGGHVSWQGTQFYFEVPDQRESRERWSLFRLDTIDRIEFRQCSFTIRNVDAQGLAGGQRVSFVELIGPGNLGELLFGGISYTPDTPAIWLEDCIARGQAPFLHAEFALPFSFSWKNGLLVSTQRLFEIGGSMVEPRWEHGAIKIWLQRLLVVADQGVGLVRSDSVAPFQLDVSVNCDDCLFATQLTSPTTPLYTLRTNSLLPTDTIPLVIGGGNNYYKNTKLVLRVESNGDRNALGQFSFDDLKGSQDQSWFIEKSPLPAPANMFSWTPPTQTVDRQSLHDFIPPGIGDGWFTRALGITPSLLPRLPDFDTLLFREKPARGATTDRLLPDGPAPESSPTVIDAPPAQSAPAQSAPAQSPPAQSPPAQSAPAQSAPAQSPPAQPANNTPAPSSLPSREMPSTESNGRGKEPGKSVPRGGATDARQRSHGSVR